MEFYYIHSDYSFGTLVRFFCEETFRMAYSYYTGMELCSIKRCFSLKDIMKPCTFLFHMHGKMLHDLFSHHMHVYDVCQIVFKILKTCL